MMHKTFWERGYSTRRGSARLDRVLEPRELCRLGSPALQERRDA